jgi:hypothetical protein
MFPLSLPHIDDNLHENHPSGAKGFPGSSNGSDLVSRQPPPSGPGGAGRAPGEKQWLFADIPAG